MLPAVKQPVKEAKETVGLPVTMRGPGGEKTQPTGTVLEDVVDELEVVLLEVVDAMVEEFVVDKVEEVVLLEVVECVEIVVAGT